MKTPQMLAIAFAVLVPAPVVAQTQNPPGDRAAAKEQRADRARERCRLNRGVDCDTPEGLKDWLLQERSPGSDPRWLAPPAADSARTNTVASLTSNRATAKDRTGQKRTLSCPAATRAREIRSLLCWVEPDLKENPTSNIREHGPGEI